MFRHALGKAIFVFAIVGTIAYSWIQLENLFGDVQSRTAHHTVQLGVNNQ